MEIGIVGLGKMGANMTKRMIQGGHTVIAFDVNNEAVRTAERSGAIPAYRLDDLPKKFTISPRVIWVMVPAGQPTEDTITQLVGKLSKGDIIIDGGNSNYKDTVRRAEMLETNGLRFVDVGTSGGIWGLTEGYSLMVGGTDKAVATIKPLLETLAPGKEQGWGHVGPSGAGHFVKMIHNGIEYGMMQAYAEGLELLRAKEDFDLDLHQIAEIWRYGSVVRSWLLDLTANALKEDPDLPDIKGWVADSGEGRWAVFESIDLDVPAPVITLALMARFTSRRDENYAAKLLAAMRQQFGGHAVKSNLDC